MRPILPVLVLVLAACAGTSTAPAEPTTAGSVFAPTSSTLQLSLTSLPATTSTSSPPTSIAPAVMTWPGEAPDVLIGSAAGAYVGDDPLTSDAPFVSGLLDDLGGGVVVELLLDDSGRISVARLLPGAADLLPLLPPDASMPIRGSIHEVADIDGRPTLILTERVDGGGEERQERLVLVDLETGTTRPIAWVAGIEETAERVSHADGLFAVTHVGHSCGRIFFLDQSGEEVSVPGTPQPPCRVHFEVPFLSATLAPNGSGLAYVAQSYDTGADGAPLVIRSDLVLLDLGTGEEVLRETVTHRPGEQIVSLDFDGEWVVMARQPPGQEGHPPTASEILGRHLAGARFQADALEVTSVRLPWAPLQVP